MGFLRAAGEPGGGFYSVLIAAGGFAMPAKLFVGNLSFQATEEDLRELFQQAGTVESVRIVTDQFTGRPRGFGFVEMATKEESGKAIEMLNGRLFRDRNLVVDEARPQPQRGGGGGPRGGGGGGGPRGGGGGGGGGWRR
jgi:cold-inducible RNA-binding protein